MNNHFEKFVFLAVIIAVVFFSRFAYPLNSGLPTLSLADSVHVASSKAPPLLVLPVSAVPGTPVAISAAGPSVTDGAVPQEISGGTVTGASNATSSFIRTTTTTVPSLTAQAALVADLQSGTIFYSENADKRWPTASITKLMTASVALDHFTLDQRITITPQIFSADPEEVTLVPGGTYTTGDLLHVMLMPSSNVAAEAFADTYDRSGFMAAMNARAAEWGMTNTYFDDPSGISAANQSTADDMLLLAQKIYTGYPQIFSFTRTPQTTITELNSGKSVPVKSINDFAGQPDFIGGKTGHTDQADGNLLSVFNDDGHPVLIIVLGTNSRFNDTQRLYSWFKSNFK